MGTLRSCTLASFGVLAVVALLSGGCDGDDDPLIVPADEVETFLEAALVDVQDLPGQDWELVSENDFDDGAEPPADSEVCQALYEEYQAVVRAREDERVGRHERSFSREGGPQVQVSIAVYDNDEANRESVETFGRIMLRDDLPSCLVDLIEASGEDIAAEGQQVEPSMEAPENGFAAASHYDVDRDGTPSPLRIETYSWQSGNAGITVSVTGEPERVTEELVTSLVAVVAAKFDAATR